MTKTCKKCGEEITTAAKLCADCALRLEQRLRGETPAPVESQANQDPDIVIAETIVRSPIHSRPDYVNSTPAGESSAAMLTRFLYWIIGGFLLGLLVLLLVTFCSYLSIPIDKRPALGLVFSVVLIESLIIGFLSGIIGAIAGDSKIFSWLIITILAITFAVFACTAAWDFAFSF